MNDLPQDILDSLLHLHNAGGNRSGFVMLPVGGVLMGPYDLNDEDSVERLKEMHGYSAGAKRPSFEEHAMETATKIPANEYEGPVMWRGGAYKDIAALRDDPLFYTAEDKVVWAAVKLLPDQELMKASYITDEYFYYAQHQGVRPEVPADVLSELQVALDRFKAATEGLCTRYQEDYSRLITF